VGAAAAEAPVVASAHAIRFRVGLKKGSDPLEASRFVIISGRAGKGQTPFQT
jgi:hypothetical protein